jgi:hypothetical protein
METLAPRLSKPGSGKGRMQRHVLNVLLEHYGRDEIPTNGRFVFYELEGRGIVRKSRKGESRRGGVDTPREQEATDALIWLRAKGAIPWSWIEDETRTLHEWRHAASVADYLSDSLDVARVNPWEPEPPPLLLVESRSLGGVLRSKVSGYLCPIAATNGHVGGFLHTDIVPILMGSDRHVLYLGDWDLQGHQIEANTRNVLEHETGREIPWERIAITEEQIDERGIDPIWKTDDRYTPSKSGWAWEAESLTQGVIVRLVTEALDALLPEPLDDVLRREAVERAEWRICLGE